MLLIAATVSLFACVDENPPTENPPVENSPTERQTLSISPDGFSIFFSDVPGKSIILADGREYRAGDLLPVFSELSDVLSLDFSECADSADIVFGSVGALSSRGIAGEFLNLSEHLDDMPSFKAFLDSNPLVRLAVSTDEYGAFYVIPYLADGGYDLPLFNSALVRELLDGEGAFVSESGELIENAVYTPYMPTSGSISVGVMKDGEPAELIKNYDTAGNIIEFMNYEIGSGALSAVSAVNMLRNYIDSAYCGFYGSSRSELFIGESAAWDADELVALLRCATALYGEGCGIFASDASSLIRLSGMLFSVPGLLDSDFVNYDGDSASDARCDTESYLALLRMRAIIDEGLVTDMPDGATVFCGEVGRGSTAFAEALPPVSLSDGEYIRIIGKEAAVASQAVALSASLSDNEERLRTALGFIDYLFSDAGMMLARYCTEDYYTETEDGVFPSEAALSLAEEYTSGSYSDFKARYLGAGILFPYGRTDTSDSCSLMSSALRAGVVSRVGTKTDDGVYLPPSPIDMYTEKEREALASNTYYQNFYGIFERIITGERQIGSHDAIETLVNEILSDASCGEYLDLKSTEAERYLRCYKRINK